MWYTLSRGFISADAAAEPVEASFTPSEGWALAAFGGRGMPGPRQGQEGTGHQWFPFPS